MKRDACLLSGMNDQVVTVGSRDFSLLMAQGDVSRWRVHRPGTVVDACVDIKRRLADGMTPEQAAPYIKLTMLMSAMAFYWDRPPSDDDEYLHLCNSVVTAWNGIDITPILAAQQALIKHCEKARVERT